MTTGGLSISGCDAGLCLHYDSPAVTNFLKVFDHNSSHDVILLFLHYYNTFFCFAKMTVGVDDSSCLDIGVDIGVGPS